MTKLDAINRLLRAVQAPDLNALTEENLTYEQQIAIDIFEQTNTFVQGLGWWFNTFKISLQPDINGNIPIPSDYLFVDPVDPTENYIVVNGKLYDVDNQTFDFSDKESVELEVVLLIDFEKLPIPAQEYIVTKAEMEMQAKIFGGVTDNSLPQRETEAYLALLKHQNKAADYNVLYHPQIQEALRRW